MKIKTTWNLKLIYENEKDPPVENDILSYEKAVDAFEKKYRANTVYLGNAQLLKQALTEYEELYGMIEPRRAYNYFHYRKEIDSSDQVAEKRLNLISDRLTKAGNKTLFFELSLGKIDKKLQTELLQSKELKHFQYFLKRLFENAKYDLSEPEEKILNLKSLPAHGLWVQGQQKLLSQQTVKFKGRELPIPEAQSMLTQLGKKDRRALTDATNEVLKSISSFAESELNAVYIDKKINDELRGFKHPYSRTILGYQNDEASIINFVNTVTKNFSISHRFYKLKAKLLKERKLEYADRAAKVGEVSLKPGFDESLGILRNAFEKTDPQFREILDSYVENGQIDVFPKKGKKGGAYCSSDIKMPTYVLLNHINSINSLKTFAHEMGHGIHAELSKSQTPLYEGHTISVAEVASTFFENIAFEEIFPKLSRKEQAIALHDRLNDAVATIFRQVAVFNYELEMHTIIREKGALTKEEIANLHNKHMSAYLGPNFKLKELDGYFFVTWSHLRYFFYVYSYAYGELISMALYNKYKENKNYIREIKKFLSAGGSKSPEDIFKEIGIDTTKPAFFETGLKKLEEDIVKLENLLK
jgi:oligoendopeptidase F